MAPARPPNQPHAPTHANPLTLPKDPLDAICTEAERLRAVVDVVAGWKAQMQQAASAAPTGEPAGAAFDFGAFQATFARLQRDYREEYELYGLGALAVAVVAPVVRARLADWAPLAEPTRDLDLFRAWRALLQTGSVASAVSAAGSSVHAKTCVWRGCG